MFAPLAIALITTTASLIDGKSRAEIKKKFNQDYFHIVLTNYKVKMAGIFLVLGTSTLETL